jgi:hypothetical protein
MSKLQTIQTLVHIRSQLFQQYFANRKLCKEYRLYRHTGIQAYNCAKLYTLRLSILNHKPRFMSGKKRQLYTSKAEWKNSLFNFVHQRKVNFSYECLDRHSMYTEKQFLQSAFPVMWKCKIQTVCYSLQTAGNTRDKSAGSGAAKYRRAKQQDKKNKAGTGKFGIRKTWLQNTSKAISTINVVKERQSRETDRLWHRKVQSHCIILYIVETQNGGGRNVPNIGTQETMREIAWWEITIWRLKEKGETTNTRSAVHAQQLSETWTRKNANCNHILRCYGKNDSEERDWG